MGIRHIGQENAKLLSKHLKNPTNFFNLKKKSNFNELLNIDGIGDTQINSIKNFFSNKNNLKVLYELDRVLNVIAELPINKTGIFRNKTFMFTGKLEGMSRAEAKSLIEKNSGKIISNVNKKLDYLIIGEKPTTKKVNLAKGLKISIFNQNQWLEMLKSTD